jgi:hypothetical protein
MLVMTWGIARKARGRKTARNFLDFTRIKI